MAMPVKDIPISKEKAREIAAKPAKLFGVKPFKTVPAPKGPRYG